MLIVKKNEEGISMQQPFFCQFFFYKCYLDLHLFWYVFEACRIKNRETSVSFNAIQALKIMKQKIHKIKEGKNISILGPSSPQAQMYQGPK